MLKKLLFLWLLTSPLYLHAQSIFTGNIFDNNNRSAALEGVLIKNLSTKSVASTDKQGYFVIPAKVGDLISFGMLGFETDTIYLINLFPKNIYLRTKVNQLDPVNITATKISPFLDLKDPNAVPARAVDYSKDRGGLRLTLGYGKYRREQAKIQELMAFDKYNEEISNNFNEEKVRRLVNFEGPGIKDFLQMYRPSVEQVKAEQPFNYAYYIAKCYRAWLKLPVSERKLPSIFKLGNNGS